MKAIITSIFVLLCIATGCETTKTQTTVPTERTINGINWYLKRIYLPEGNIDIDNPNAFIRLDPEKNSVGGKGGCNNFGCRYTINGQNIDFKNIFSTKMFCEKYQAQEDSFFKQLEKVNRFDVKEGKLLFYKGEELLLEFSK